MAAMNVERIEKVIELFPMVLFVLVFVWCAHGNVHKLIYECVVV